MTTRSFAVDDHTAIPESDSAWHFDFCDVCGWPVEKRRVGWQHEAKNPVEWTDKREVGA